MKKQKPRSFIIVAEIVSRHVCHIVEGPVEGATKKLRDVLDNLCLEKMNQLAKQFPYQTHDITLTRAVSFDDLKDFYPEFSNWNKATRESLRLECGTSKSPS